MEITRKDPFEIIALDSVYVIFKEFCFFTFLSCLSVCKKWNYMIQIYLRDFLLTKKLKSNNAQNIRLCFNLGVREFIFGLHLKREAFGDGAIKFYNENHSELISIKLAHGSTFRINDLRYGKLKKLSHCVMYGNLTDNFPVLESLSISFLENPKQLEKLTSLTKLSISGLDLAGVELNNLTNLLHLKLERCRNFQPINLRSLELLSLSNFYNHGFVDNLNLKTLIVNFNCVIPDSVKHLTLINGDCIKIPKNIESLSLIKCDDIMLCSNENLKYLTICSDSYLDDNSDYNLPRLEKLTEDGEFADRGDLGDRIRFFKAIPTIQYSGAVTSLLEMEKIKKLITSCSELHNLNVICKKQNFILESLILEGEVTIKTANFECYHLKSTFPNLKYIKLFQRIGKEIIPHYWDFERKRFIPFKTKNWFWENSKYE